MTDHDVNSPPRQAQRRTDDETPTTKPTAGSMLTSASKLNLSIFPFSKPHRGSTPLPGVRT